MTNGLISYRQDLRFGRETFELEKYHLVVSVRAFGLSRIQRFQISDIKRLDTASERVPSFVWVPLGFMILATCLGAYLLKNGSFFSYSAAAVLFYFALLFAFRGVKGLKRNEVVKVVTQEGVTICSIWRPLDEDLEFEEFVSALRSRLPDQDMSKLAQADRKQEGF